MVVLLFSSTHCDLNLATQRFIWPHSLFHLVTLPFSLGYTPAFSFILGETPPFALGYTPGFSFYTWRDTAFFTWANSFYADGGIPPQQGQFVNRQHSSAMVVDIPVVLAGGPIIMPASSAIHYIDIFPSFLPPFDAAAFVIAAVNSCLINRFK